MFLNKAKEIILDFIFPKFCLGCLKEGVWLCRSCRKKIIYVKTQVCPDCGRISRKGRFCRQCRNPNIALSGVIIVAYYEEGPLRELIHNFKYNHILDLAQFLGEIMSQAYKQNLNLKENTIFVPVPMDWLGRAARGYNQAEILAERVSRDFKMPMADVLKKRRCQRQVELAGNQRRQNLKDAFSLNQKVNIKGKTIILVDDVITTGTTLNQAAKILKKAGAKKIWGLALAKG